MEGRHPADPDERYRRLVDHSPDAIAVHSDGVIRYVNPAGERWMRVESGALVGHPITSMVAAESVGGMLRRVEALRAEGEASPPSEAVLVRVDGTRVPVEAVSVRTEWAGRPAYQVVFRDLRPFKAVQRSLRLQAALVDHVSDAIFATTCTGEVTSWNPAAERLYGRLAADVIGLSASAVVGSALDPAQVVAAGGSSTEVHHSASGSPRTVRVSVSPMEDGYVLICTDLSALLRAEKHFRTVVGSLEDGVVVLSRDGMIESINPAARRVLSRVDDEVVAHEGGRWTSLPAFDRTGRQLEPHEYPTGRLWGKGESSNGMVMGYRLADGTTMWLSVHCVPLVPDDPKCASAVLSVTDITDSFTETARLEFEATHDVLTGLPNRSAIEHTIAESMAAELGSQIGVLFIDLDKLKSINDTLGHCAGDDVLLIVGERLRRAMRSTDIVGRLGGDEFVAVLREGISAEEIGQLAERVHATLARPLYVEGSSLSVGASIGALVLDSGDPRSAREILRDADYAMYEAKIAGGGRTRYFGPRLPTW